MPNKSRAVCPLTFVGCLEAAEGLLGAAPWIPKSPEQRAFVDGPLAQMRGAEAVLSPDEFARIASGSKPEIDAFLAERGFTLECPRIEKGDFGVASTLSVLVNWLEEGEETRISPKGGGAAVPAFKIKDGGGRLRWYGDRRDMVVRLATKSARDTVAIAPYGGDPNDQDVLAFIAAAPQAGSRESYGMHTAVEVPMVDFDVQGSADWLVGLGREDGWGVSAAMQQNVFKMNHLGARAKSAAAMAMTRGISFDDTYVFDEPFLVWIEREGFQGPLFALYCAEDSWKAPANLD